MKNNNLENEMVESGSNIPFMYKYCKERGYTTLNHHDNWVKVGTTSPCWSLNSLYSYLLITK